MKEMTQHDIIARMTPEQKLNAAWGLYVSAFELKRAALRKKYPERPEDEIRRLTKEAFLSAG
jgi:hypothetical protein